MGCAGSGALTSRLIATLPDLRRELPAILRWCEKNNVPAPGRNQYRHLVHGSKVADWLDQTGVSITSHPEMGDWAGDVEVMLKGEGGAVGDADDIPGWLSQEAASERTARKVRKLVASGHAERHLFLIVEPTGAPFRVFDPLAADADVPSTDPDLSDVSHVWLMPVPWWSPAPLLLWTSGIGWSRHALPQPHPSTGPVAGVDL